MSKTTFVISDETLEEFKKIGLSETKEEPEISNETIKLTAKSKPEEASKRAFQKLTEKL